MVIFDNTTNFNNRIKGMLYISIMDIDYLMTKYESLLKSTIPSDYFEAFLKELEQRKNEDKLSEQYYSILRLGIETDEDEELLKIIKEEVQKQNLFTKSNLDSINREDLENLIKPLKNNVENLNNEELYKLRSYMMSEYIFDLLDQLNIYNMRLYSHAVILGTSESYKDVISNLENIGLSSNIVESDYFNNSKILEKQIEVKWKYIY